MAFTHLQINDGLPHGAMVRSALAQIIGGFRGLVDITNTLQTMIDGDGSQASQFTEVATRLGFQGASANADAKAAFDELMSLRGKLETDNSVDHVNAAMLQAANKLR